MIPNSIKRITLPIEYICFLMCLCYWFFYSLVRTKGVPVYFSGFQVHSTLAAILASVVLLFNSLFFSRLFLELALRISSLRANLIRFLFKNILPVFIVLLLITFATGGRFDYASYKLQWHNIIEGQDPWGFVEGGMVNAYGYVFNFLSTLYSIHSLLPKFFFILLLLLFCWRLILTQPREIQGLIFFLCINPFTISTVAIYGFSDGLCSLLLGFALLERSQESLRSSFISGVMLSLSILSKFYSIVALPIFIQTYLTSRLFKSFMKGLSSTSIVVLILSYLFWGNSIFTPLLFAQSRDPSFLTLWKYVPHPELRTVVFLVVSVFGVAIALKRKDISPSLRTASILSIVFGTYYLGHQQFYLGILIALIVYTAEASKVGGLGLGAPTLWSFALMLGWLIFVQTGFELFDEFKPTGFQQLLPLFSFLNSTILLASGLFWLSIKPSGATRTLTVS